MQQKLKATIVCFFLSCSLYAQYGWLPPVTFPAQSQFCDSTPWKLVLFDDFNGYWLNANNWITYYSWDGMPGGDNDHWNDARKTGGWDGVHHSWNTVVRDENIVVSNGTCKLIVKNEPANWHCNTCPDTNATRYYTAGMLATPYHRSPSGAPNFLNSGMFEVRMKMPLFARAHTTLWTWHGTNWDGSMDYGVNEIDMAEGYGYESNPDYPYGSVNYSNLHAWGPDPKDTTQINPYHLPRNPSISLLYPNQNWWNIGQRNYHDIGKWHTYNCAWDTSVIKLSLDGRLINTIWKYYTREDFYRSKDSHNPTHYFINVGSNCIGSRTGEYNITYGYPYNSTHSECNFRITTVRDGGQSESVPVSNCTILGQAEIDYVKIFQRHPEQDGHTELCGNNTYPTTPAIIGSSEVCAAGRYTLSPATSGTWSVFDDDVLYLSNQSSSGCKVSKKAAIAFTQGWVSFSYGNGNPACPLKTVYKSGLYCHRSKDWDIVIPYVLDNKGDGYFQLIAELYHKRDVSDSTTPVVSWNISINSGQDFYDKATAQKYKIYGQYASTPSFSMKETESYNIRWIMNVTDASGIWSRRGERNSKTPLMQQEKDKHTYYLNAYIDNKDYYDTAVYHGVTGSMVSEQEFADSLYMDEMIEKIKSSLLEPYLNRDGLDVFILKNGDGTDKPKGGDSTDGHIKITKSAE